MPDSMTSRPERAAASLGYSREVNQSGADMNARRMSLAVKRAVDILGSLLALALFLPILMLAALAIKLTSKGPVLFRQIRVGQHAEQFTFLKFRSMYVNNDDSIHREYVESLIKLNTAAKPGKNGTEPVYKLTNDPRITPIGRFLRRTSIDELPQLINVLSGEMSLVGPRPAVPYEVQHYTNWHRRRLAVKPGITGLWQVNGRSRLKFADMVALDLEYAQSWSLLLDLKILSRTPAAVIFGGGAY